MNSLNEKNDSLTIETTSLPMDYFFLINIAYVYLLPITSSICFFFNLLSLIVFICGKEMKNGRYGYFKAKTIAETIFTLVSSLSPLSQVSSSSLVGSLAAQIITVYGVVGACGVVLIFLGFIELLILYDRYITVKPSSKLKLKINHSIFIGIFLAISIAVNIPFFFDSKIILIEYKGTSIYTRELTEFGQSYFLFYYWFVYAFLSNCIYILLIPIAGFGLVFEFGRFVKRKNVLTNQANNSNNNPTNSMTNEQFVAKKNLTTMILVLTGVFLISRTFHMCIVCYHTYVTLKNSDTIINSYLYFFGYQLNFPLTTGLSFIIYIKFNKHFRSSLLSLLKKCSPSCIWTLFSRG
jgi:hypothetical protein